MRPSARWAHRRTRVVLPTPAIPLIALTHDQPQREHAQFLVSDKKAHYILVVKKNQPSLYAQVKNPALAGHPSR